MPPPLCSPRAPSSSGHPVRTPSRADRARSLTLAPLSGSCSLAARGPPGRPLSRLLAPLCPVLDSAVLPGLSPPQSGGSASKASSAPFASQHVSLRARPGPCGSQPSARRCGFPSRPSGGCAVPRSAPWLSEPGVALRPEKPGCRPPRLLPLGPSRSCCFQTHCRAPLPPDPGTLGPSASLAGVRLSRGSPVGSQVPENRGCCYSSPSPG